MLKTAVHPKSTVTEKMFSETVMLLSSLIRTPALSGNEKKRADIIFEHLRSKGVLGIERKKNNVWAYTPYFDPSKPTLLLNSHLDTVAPNKGYTRDPYQPDIEDGKLYGLGSNDAGGSLVCLLSAFLHFYGQEDLAYNIAFAATAEEEVSGRNGIELIYPDLVNVTCAIVGEPTRMEVAIAEKGLLVIDCEVAGVAGHAARDKGINAIYKAMEDINWINSSPFGKESPVLGKVRMSVTMIHAGKQHNIIPDRCSYTIDVRVTDQYTHEEILEVLRQHLHAELKPRSLRLKPSSAVNDHPLVQAANRLGYRTFGSDTTSDQALIPVTSVKIGPGDSLRSHTSDEFIYLDEIRTGIEKYITYIETVIS